MAPARDVSDELDHLTARLVALEAIVTHVAVPLLVATGPELARELLENVRSDFVVRPPSQREQIVDYRRKSRVVSQGTLKRGFA